MAETRRPNTFILGAPKCGTTSLYEWLSEHPRVYMAPHKEPNFFNTDHEYFGPPDLESYEALFEGAGEHHDVVGESTVWYLYSDIAVPNILDYAPEAKFIVCVRNPIEMAYSLHDQQVYSGNEHIKSFRKAWELQSERRRGGAVPAGCHEPSHLLYGNVCKVGAQIERLYGLVDRESVCLVFLDDIKSDAEGQYRRVLRFLGVEPDDRAEFSKYNPAGERRFSSLQRIMQVGSYIRRLVGIPRFAVSVWRWMSAVNTKQRDREPMTPEMRAKLERYFSDDIELLEDLTGRDLTHWRREP